MPYIVKGNRKPIDKFVSQATHEDLNIAHMLPGDLNYLITQLLLAACKDRNSYTAYNELMGVLECVKQEFYRRQVVPYENEKRLINGDAFR